MLIINISYKPIKLEDLNYITTQIIDYKPLIDEDGNKSSGTGVDILSDINGNIYISLDSTNARDKENLTTVNIMMSILLVFSIIFMLISFYIISHADRFPRAIRWLVKEDYIKNKNF